MNVTLIDYTGAGSPADYTARLLVYVKNTRLTQGDETRQKVWAMPWLEILEELTAISKTIRSSWEFVDYTFEIQGVTRAFTHQLVRTRTGSYAQQAQRVVDMSDFETLMPDSVVSNEGCYNAWEDTMQDIKGTYQHMLQCGIPAQDARGVLPTNVLTNIIAKFDLRTMADLVGKRENLRVQGEYQDVVRYMKAGVLGVHPWAAPFLNPERTSTPALDALLARELGSGSPVDKPALNDALKELDALKGIWG